MKEATTELIVAERRHGFLTEVIQNGRKRPVKYRHYLKVPYFLYEELRTRGVINPEDYYIDQSAFFEFRDNEMTISFINIKECQDLHMKIDHYLIVKFAGSYPVKCGGISKI